MFHNNWCQSLILYLYLFVNMAQSYFLYSRFNTPSATNEWWKTWEQTADDHANSRISPTNALLEMDIPFYTKRSASAVKPMPAQEPVCEMKILSNYSPKFGQIENGTRVEIQQDVVQSLRTTFVECEDSRASCNGIDEHFTSECITVYGLQRAGIRPEGTTGPYVDGLIKVPVACQCRLRRKLQFP